MHSEKHEWPLLLLPIYIPFALGAPIVETALLPYHLISDEHECYQHTRGIWGAATDDNREEHGIMYNKIVINPYSGRSTLVEKHIPEDQLRFVIREDKR